MTDVIVTFKIKDFLEVENDWEMTSESINDVLREVVGWQKRYNEYKELGKIFKAVESTKKKIKKKLKITI